MAEPFTLPHFKTWSSRLILENGQPFKLAKFQADFIADVFAGTPVCWLIIPEGNGKTTLAAALALYGLRFGQEPMIPIAASSRDQSQIMYRQARGFVKRSELDDYPLWFECFDGYYRIDLRTQGRTKRGEIVGSIKCHAADASTADGVIFNPYGFVDELHRHSSMELLETWRGKYEKRGGQIIVISTAGEPGSGFEEMRASIREQGKLTREAATFKRFEHARIVMHEWAVPSGASPDDMRIVAKANPLPGLTAKALKAKRSDPTMSAAHWRRFNCNLPEFSEGIEPFVDLADWDALGGGEPIPHGNEVCIGADGSRTWDTTVVAWASLRDDLVTVEARVFSVRPDQPKHIFHQGGKIDFDDVEGFIIDRFGTYRVLEAAYDPRYLERSMEIVDARLSQARIFAVEPQSKQMRAALQDFYTLIAEKRLRHIGDDVIRAQIENTRVDRYEGTAEIRRVGKKDQRKAIDAVPAMAMAVWRAQHLDEFAGMPLAVAI